MIMTNIWQLVEANWPGEIITLRRRGEVNTLNITNFFLIKILFTITNFISWENTEEKN